MTQFATGSKQYHNDNYISALTLLYFFRTISNFGESEETSKSQEAEQVIIVRKLIEMKGVQAMDTLECISKLRSLFPLFNRYTRMY